MGGVLLGRAPPGQQRTPSPAVDVVTTAHAGAGPARPVIRLREFGERLGAPERPYDPLELGSSQATLPEGLVVAMGQDRQWVVDTLRRLGYVHEADEAARVLPDPVEMEQLSEFGDRYGISVAELMSRMGGSP